MDEKEAKIKADADNNAAISPFCPLTNGKCNTGCVCWQEAKAYEIEVSLDGGIRKGRGQYKVSWVGCNNSMFSGNRECNSNY